MRTIEELRRCLPFAEHGSLSNESLQIGVKQPSLSFVLAFADRHDCIFVAFEQRSVQLSACTLGTFAPASMSILLTFRPVDREWVDRRSASGGERNLGNRDGSVEYCSEENCIAFLTRGLS